MAKNSELERLNGDIKTLTVLYEERCKNYNNLWSEFKGYRQGVADALSSLSIGD